MATSFNDVKTYIPGVGWRAYLFAQYQMQGGACTPNPLNIARQCMYLAGAGVAQDTWATGHVFEGLFPNVGEFISADVGSYTQCYKVLEILDEATFMTGICVSCYNNGFQGQCSDVFITTPPYPGDPNGCRYNNSINNNGIAKASFPIGTQAYSYIQSDCQNCTTGAPPVFEPNMVEWCCAELSGFPPETYQLSPAVLDDITGTSVGQIGVTNLQQAFIGDLYIGGASTGDKCLRLKEDYPPFGPMAYTINFSSIAFDSCIHLDQTINNACCGTPPPPPPLYEWCCMTGVAGPAGQSTCTQVLVGTCQPGTTNYAGGPFVTQADCQTFPCGTPPPPNTWYCPEEINMATNSTAGCCIIVPPSGVPNSNYQTFTTQQDCQNQTQCCNETSQGMASCCGGVEQGDPCTYNSWNNYFTAQNRIDYCNNHCLPGQPYWNGGAFSLPYCPCCPHDIGCEPPFAKLAKLTSKLDMFTKWKNKSLGK